MGFEFERVTPESVGVPSRVVEELIEELNKVGMELHSMRLLRHGKLYAEAYWEPYAADVPHIMFSLSKSFTSTAIGFAVQEGLMSLDEKLVDIFPEYVPENPSENLLKAEVRHLLMMGCGHEEEIDNLGRDSGNWISDFMEQPFVFEPGTKFMYNTAGTNMLCAILKKKAGVQLTEFLRPRLFDPLEMKGEIKCDVLPDGTEAGGYGYKHTTENLSRFFQFVANKGSWQGKQLLNKEWFDLALSKQIENKGCGNPAPDWCQGYGFQFWMCQPEGVVRGDGAFGQYGIVMQNQDAVVIFTSSELDMQIMETVIWKKLLPAMQDSPLPENDDDFKRLQYVLGHTKLDTMTSVRGWHLESVLNDLKLETVAEITAFTNIVGGFGIFEQDSGRLKSLGFDISENGKAYLLVEESERSYKLDLGMQSSFERTEIDGMVYAANSRLRAFNKLEFQIRNLRATTGTRFILEFGEDKAVMTAESTLPIVGGLGDPQKPIVEFKYVAGGDKLKEVFAQTELD